ERDAAFVQLPGGEPSALQVRPRFRHEDVDLFPLFERHANYPKRAADAARGERAGVALRHYLSFARHEFRAEPSDGFVRSFFLKMDFPGFVDHSLPNLAEVRSLGR